MVETEAQVDELAASCSACCPSCFPSCGAATPTATSGDLTLAQLSILLTLLDQGPIRMTDLAAHERVRTPTTTVAIRRLEKLGLVKRSRDPSDLRAVLVDITPRASCSTGKRWPPQGSLAALLCKLTEDDSRRLTKAFGPLERLAEQETGQKTASPTSPAPLPRSMTAACCPAAHR